MKFGEWFKGQRKSRGRTQEDVIQHKTDGHPTVNKSRSWLARLEIGDSRAQIPDRSTCIALGKAIGMFDPEEVWAQAREERLRQFDPDLWEWAMAQSPSPAALGPRDTETLEEDRRWLDEGGPFLGHVQLGRVLRLMRQEAGFTQDQLSRHLGISKPHVSNIETHRERRKISLGLLADWARACGRPLQLFFMTSDPVRPRYQNHRKSEEE